MKFTEIICDPFEFRRKKQNHFFFSIRNLHHREVKILSGCKQKKKQIM